MTLPLYTWFQFMGFNPFHAFGIADTTNLAVDTGCDTLVRRYAWQNSDAAGHAEILEAIDRAETQLLDYLGYAVAPRYTTKTLIWPRVGDTALVRRGPWDVDGRWLNVPLGEGYVQAIGIESLTVISAAAAVVYSDADGDGYQDTFTVGPIATTITDTTQIAAYFSAADRFTGPDFDAAVGDHWRIQPIVVTISAGFVTIRGPKQVLAKPLKYEGVTNIGPNGLDPAVAANFVTTLDIYQRATNPNGTTVDTSQAVIVWETEPMAGYTCCGSTTLSTAFSGSPFDPAAVAQAVGRVGIRDGRRGIVTPAEATYNATTGVWSAWNWTICAEPDRVLIRYLAGYPLESSGQMDRKWRRAVAVLAAAELDKPVCGCTQANQRIAYWQFDLARTSGANDEAYGTTQTILECPFGTRRGQWQAWQDVSNLQKLGGLAAG